MSYDTKQNLTTMKNEKSLTEKIDAINLDALASKAIINRQIWKKDILAGFRTEKTARRMLRNKQLELSKSVCKFAKLKDDKGLKVAIKSLEEFYATNLVTRNKFTNISDEKPEGVVINLASEISQNLK